ncbi:MAG: TolC family protein [Kiritimatiellae bacterium]|nr:TolC family protein [Kiritimatiellia bacterium]
MHPSRTGVCAGLVVCALIPCVFAADPAAEPERLDVSSAISRALKRNRHLARAAKLVQSRKLDVDAARAAFAVRVIPNTSLGIGDDNGIWDYGLRAVKRLGWGTDVQLGARVLGTELDEDTALHRASLDVEVYQPLFRRFGPLVHREPIAQAGSALQEARRRYEQQKADLVVDVVSTYEAVIRLERQITAEESFLQRADRLYRLTRARERQGHTTRVDTLRVELQRGQAALALESSREMLNTTRRNLAEQLGVPLNTVFALVPPPLLDMRLPPVEEAVAVALANRLDYAQALADHEDSRRRLRIAARDLYPDVGLTTRYERYGEGEDVSDAGRLDQEGWFVGLAAGRDFNPARDRVSVAQAEIGEWAAKETVSLTALTITRQVQEALAAYRRATTDIGTAERNETLAEGRARLARRLFKLGRGDNFAVTDAEQAYVLAQNRALSARAEASLAGYRLLRALGTLIEYPQELKAPDRTLHKAESE